jgi:predicted kinase
VYLAERNAACELAGKFASAVAGHACPARRKVTSQRLAKRIDGWLAQDEGSAHCEERASEECWSPNLL